MSSFSYTVSRYVKEKSQSKFGKTFPITFGVKQIPGEAIDWINFGSIECQTSKPNSAKR